MYAYVCVCVCVCVCVLMLYNVHLGGGDCFGCLVLEHFPVVSFVGASVCVKVCECACVCVCSFLSEELSLPIESDSRDQTT